LPDRLRLVSGVPELRLGDASSVLPFFQKASPLITLTRKLARQVQDVFRRGLPRLNPPAVVLRTDHEGLRISAWSPEVALEYRETGLHASEQISLPLAALKRCAGSRSEAVTVERGDSDRVVLRWNDLGIPQVAEFDAPEILAGSPAIPEKSLPAGQGFLVALRDAIGTTDSQSSRYALDCVRLRGTSGRIDATDSRQALIQSGFNFSWDDDVLVAANPVFKSTVFSPHADVQVGRSENWIAFQIGPWAIQLAIDKGRRFPDVDGVMPSRSAPYSRLRLSDADADFLVRALPRLPRDDMSHDSVTVDLNGSVAIRARSQAGAAPTELVLVGSQRLGEQIGINSSRRYLERAVRLGFRDFHFVSAEAPAHCSDGCRQYVWALLSPQGFIPSADNAVRIESSVADQPRSTRASGLSKADATADPVRSARMPSQPVGVTSPQVRA
jgi:hypothetical protein